VHTSSPGDRGRKAMPQERRCTTGPLSPMSSSATSAGQQRTTTNPRFPRQETLPMKTLACGSFRNWRMLAAALPLLLLVACDLTLDSTSPGDEPGAKSAAVAAATRAPLAVSASAKAATVQNPILFVTQVPVAG